MRAKELLSKVNEVAASRWKQHETIDTSGYDPSIDNEVYYVLAKAGYKFVGNNKFDTGIFSNNKQRVGVRNAREGGSIIGLVHYDLKGYDILIDIYYIKKSNTWEVFSKLGSGIFSEEDVVKLLKCSLSITDAKPIEGWKKTDHAMGWLE